MKLNDAEMSNWVIELHDGALEIQRNFQFESKADLNAFVGMIERYMKCPGLTVSATSISSSETQASIRIHLLPERALLRAAGEVAASCEHEFTQLRAQSSQFAA